MTLLVDYGKIKSLQISLKKRLRIRSDKSSPNSLVINYSRILFNLVISPNN